MGELRQAFKSGRTRSVGWRKSQLQAILKLMDEKEDQIFKALQQDLGMHPVEAYRDEGQIPLLFFPASGEVLPEPLGLALIFVSWNFPIALALDPLIGAISAGNAVVLKPSELAPACSFLANTIPLYLDSNAIKVVEGGTDIAEQLLQQKWDKIFFTVENEDQRILWSCTTRYDDGAARRSAGGGGRDVQSGGVKPVSCGNNDGDAAVTSLL
ncbi:hypothetical protein C3L33_01384, partial [Rhododendron williamsianum]